MNVAKFIGDIRYLLKFNDLYYETENDFCFDCRINKQFKFDKGLLDEMKILGILKADKKRYTRVQRFKDKVYRWVVIDKQKFKSLERLILSGVDGNGKNT